MDDTPRQMINWIPIKELVHSRAPEWQRLLATDGKQVQIYGAMVLRDRILTGSTNMTHYAVITLPNGQPA